MPRQGSADRRSQKLVVDDVREVGESAGGRGDGGPLVAHHVTRLELIGSMDANARTSASAHSANGDLRVAPIPVNESPKCRSGEVAQHGIGAKRFDRSQKLALQGDRSVSDRTHRPM